MCIQDVYIVKYIHDISWNFQNSKQKADFISFECVNKYGPGYSNHCQSRDITRTSRDVSTLGHTILPTENMTLLRELVKVAFVL